MELLLGFLIALVVGLTGVGAGSVTAPVLLLFLGLKPAESVGTALIFASIIKLVVLPLYLYRKQVSYRVLAFLCGGGIPGVIAGFYLLGLFDVHKQEHILYLLLGGTIAAMALWNLYRATQQAKARKARDRAHYLPLISAFIGAEVGFSSAGAGALGSAALLSLTELTPAQVVGTDMVFGLIVSLIGGGFHLSAGHYDAAILLRLAIGGICGVLIGANLSAVLPPKPLKIALSIWLVVIGAQLCWRALM